MRKEMREKYETKIDALQNRIRQLEEQQSLEAKFFELEHRLDARQLARDQAKRESEIIPKSELRAKIEKLQRNGLLIRMRVFASSQSAALALGLPYHKDREGYIDDR